MHFVAIINKSTRLSEKDIAKVEIWQLSRINYQYLPLYGIVRIKKAIIFGKSSFISFF
jgi:hypothetical protein